MIARLRAGWRRMIEHPLVQLELRRVQRRRWWPGRRGLTLFVVLVAVAYGCAIGSVALLVGLIFTQDVVAASWPSDVPWLVVLVGTPSFCLIGGGGWLLGTLLPWLAPALTAAAIAGEREVGSFGLLRATLLTDRSLVLGKLGGCLVRLWPALVALALLTPVRAVVTLGSSLDLFALAPLGGGNDHLAWVVFALAILRGALAPWGKLALHAAIGLFVSTLSRSTGNAIALAYSAILVLRVGMWLGQWVVTLGVVALASYDSLMALVGFPLGIAVFEFGGALLFVQAAIWRLRRV